MIGGPAMMTRWMGGKEQSGTPAIALPVFGAGRTPEIGKSFGRRVMEFKRARDERTVISRRTPRTRARGTDRRPGGRSIGGGAPRLVRTCAYLLSYYLGSLLGRKRPLLGGIKLTHDCNLACIHCPFWKRKQASLSFPQAVGALKILHEWGTRILIIEGGEPFLWRDGHYRLADVVAEAKKLFFSVGVTTNGTFPIEVDSDIVWVSVDGMKETHDRIRGGSFDTVIANIEASAHPKIFAHITVNTLNCDEVPRLVEFLAPRVKGITIQFHYPYEDRDDELFLPIGRRKAVLDELIALKRRGLPVADSCACLRALKANRWKCRPWMIASVEPTGKAARGCYVKNRGEIACERCGFSAHTEISLAYEGVLGSILAGGRIFYSPRRTDSRA